MLQFILHPLNIWNCRKEKGALCVETDREITRVGEEKRQGGKENGERTSEHEKDSGNGLFVRHVAGMQQCSENMPCFPRHCFN